MQWLIFKFNAVNTFGTWMLLIVDYKVSQEEVQFPTVVTDHWNDCVRL